MPFQMTEFHKKEKEELENEHEKLFEAIDEDRKKVSYISSAHIIDCS